VVDKIKKFILLVIAIFVSFVITEVFIRVVIGYPVSGELMKIIGISGPKSYGKLYEPHSKYWNVEGGNNVFERNNVGLPGLDIITSDSTGYVLVLGSSVVEAQQVPRNQMATSVFHDLLTKENDKYQIVNLGTSGVNPYQQWFRTCYFESLYEPSVVIMVLDEHSYEYLSRIKSQKLNFDLPNRFGEEHDISLTKQISHFLKNNLSTLNILFQNIHNLQPTKKQDNKKYAKYDVDISLEKLEICISEFQKKYKEKFILISILNDKEINNEIQKICNNKKLNYFIDDSTQSSINRFHGTGHLNVRGNRGLGVLLHEVFKKSFIE